MELYIDKLSKSYGSNKALSEFEARFDPGIYALLGPNGSGKSTLMNIITGNLKADSGRVLLNGEETVKMGARFRAELGFMPQYPGLYPEFTVEEMLWYIASLKNMAADKKRKERREYLSGQILSALQAVELDDVANRRIRALSGGMKQRLALAQAVLADPSILILDEPTAGLDPKQRITIRNYISKIAFNKVVIIATHVVSDVEYIAKRAIMLKKGVIVENDTPQNLIKKMDGKVWRIAAMPEEVTGLQEKFRVTNISRDEDSEKVFLRVLSDEMPEKGAVMVQPTLEDVYLYIFESQEMTE